MKLSHLSERIEDCFAPLAIKKRARSALRPAIGGSGLRLFESKTRRVEHTDVHRIGGRK